VVAGANRGQARRDVQSVGFLDRAGAVAQLDAGGNLVNADVRRPERELVPATVVIVLAQMLGYASRQRDQDVLARPCRTSPLRLTISAGPLSEEAYMGFDERATAVRR
jgi:hypothetical protein